MISHRIDKNRRLVTVTGHGILLPEQISANQAAIRNDPDFDPSFALMVDFRKASFANVASAHVRQHAEDDPFGPKSPRAIVISGKTDIGMVGIFEAYSQLVEHHGPVKGFYDLNSAWDWIESVR